MAKDNNDKVITFPVPIEDIGDATFMDVDKGIYFMRWIRQHMDTIRQGSLAKQVNAAVSYAATQWFDSTRNYQIYYVYFILRTFHCYLFTNLHTVCP